MSENETIHESDTGAKKARNDVRMSLVPTEELLEVARHYSRGSEKYGDHNWRKGMPFSWHYDAMQRHLMDFWGGEDIDAETGSEHLDAVIFHALALKYGRKHHPGQDDRYDSPAARLARNPEVLARLEGLDEAALENAVEVIILPTLNPGDVKFYDWTDCDGDLLTSRKGVITRVYSDGHWTAGGDDARWLEAALTEHGPYTRVEK